MPRYRKIPVVIEASRWHRNGDHPLDYADAIHSPTDGVGNCSHEIDGVTYPCEQTSPDAQREHDWEGQVVRRYRNPEVSGESPCRHCSVRMHDHGWIDTLEGGHIVCPGDWIITGVADERYPCKHDIFVATYEPA